MWKFRLGTLIVTLLLSSATTAATIEVDVQGLTCAFCVDSLQRQLKKLPDIEQVDVSLRSKKVRIISSADSIDIEQIRKIVIDSGFTPVKVSTIEDEG